MIDPRLGNGNGATRTADLLLGSADQSVVLQNIWGVPNVQLQGADILISEMDSFSEGQRTLCEDVDHVDHETSDTP